MTHPRNALVRYGLPAAIVGFLVFLPNFGAQAQSGGSGKGSGAGVARADFNGDGYGDLAIGAPYENIGDLVNAGAVYVIYGSPSGLLAPVSSGATPAAQRWTQSSSGIPGSPETDDHFGMALAAGDFNNDGFPDLAIGVPGEDLDGIRDAGYVIIIHGSSQGLSATASGIPGPATLSINDLDSPDCYAIRLDGTCDSNHWTYALKFDSDFGSSLAWGDFDGDGNNDLAVGAPGAYKAFVDNHNPIAPPFPTDVPRVGLAAVFYGAHAAPLTGTGRKSILFQPNPFDGNHPDIYGEAYDNFATTLAAGDFNGDGRSDLAVGVPREGLGSVAGAGMVQVYYGCTSRLASCRKDSFAQILASGIGDLPGTAEASDFFGASLAVGDFDGDYKDDLAIGVPDENVSNMVNAGIVQVMYGSSSGLSSSNVQTWSQSDLFGSSPSVFEGSPSEPYDYFGFALAAGDFNGDGKDDLAIGVPGEDVVSDRTGTLRNLTDAGEVDILYGSANGLSKTGRAPQMWHQDTINIQGVAEAGDRLGSSLSAWNFGGPSVVADLAIGVPLDNGTEAGNCGGVAVLYGGTANNGLSSAADQLWNPDSPNVPGSCQTDGKFGHSIH